MRKTLRLLAAVALTLSICLSSCSKSPKEMLVGEYEVTSISTDQKMIPEIAEIWNETVETIKKTSGLTLRADGSAEDTSNGITRKGTWEVYGDEEENGEGWRLKITREDKSTINMEIHDLSDSGFTYIQPDDASNSTTVIVYSKTKK